MNITELKIKENVEPDVVAEAIEFIATSCFVNGGYNPYYQSFAERMAVVRYFLDGIEFDENDSLFVISEIDDVKKLVNRFFTDEKFSDSAKLMKVVRSNAEKIIEFRKERLIHGADALELIATRIDEVGKFINDLDVALGNLVNLDLSNMTQEDIENGRKLVEKMANGNIVQVLKEAANFDIDGATQEIIDAKNKQIEELKKRNDELEKEYNARNVLVFKKEDDKK